MPVSRNEMYTHCVSVSNLPQNNHERTKKLKEVGENKAGHPREQTSKYVRRDARFASLLLDTQAFRLIGKPAAMLAQPFL